MTSDSTSLLVVGSVAYDSVKTGSGSRTEALGGSAVYFSLASSYFYPVELVAVVGEDFRENDIEFLNTCGIDISGLERRPGKTFRWVGVYDDENMNSRDTLDTQLNVFADFSPKLNASQRRAEYLFLANIHPRLQMQVLSQMEVRPKLVALDSMNFWIDGNKTDLFKVVEQVDVLIVDEGEARQFAGEANLVSAAQSILRMGPRAVIVKRGEHGVLMYFRTTEGSYSAFACPALPLAQVTDPTGAGDSFAGGFIGYLAASGLSVDTLTSKTIRQAVAVGTVMGSIVVQGFSVESFYNLSRSEIQGRFDEFFELTKLEEIRTGNMLPWHKPEKVKTEIR